MSEEINLFEEARNAVAQRLGITSAAAAQRLHAISLALAATRDLSLEEAAAAIVGMDRHTLAALLAAGTAEAVHLIVNPPAAE